MCALARRWRCSPTPAAAERLLGLPAPAGGQAEPRRLTVEEIRQRLHLAAQRVPKQEAVSVPKDPGTPSGAR
jgi:hypothetical protein